MSSPRPASLALLAALAATLGAPAARAADLLRAAFPAPQIAEATAFGYDWSGGAVGLQGGWGMGSDKVGFGSPTALAPSARDLGDLGLRGGSIGLRAGYDVQSPFSYWVAGVAADVNLDGMRRSFDGVTGPLVASGSARLAWDGSARLRVGYAYRRFLFYVTGGVALAQEKYRVSLRAPVTGDLAASKTFLGATLGLGAEYAMTRHLSLGLEYRYTTFGGKTVSGPLSAGGAPVGAGQTHPSPNFHRLAASVNWRF